MPRKKTGESKADTSMDRRKGVKEMSKRDMKMDMMPMPPKKKRGK